MARTLRCCDYRHLGNATVWNRIHAKMIGLAILVCLLAGPNGKWVKKFLPTTANRLVFLIIVLFIVGSGIF